MSLKQRFNSSDLIIYFILPTFFRLLDTSESVVPCAIDPDDSDLDREAISNYKIPAGVEVFEITGPLFFGAAYKFKDAIRFIERRPGICIIRMRKVLIIDATGIKTIDEVRKEFKRHGTRLILSEVHSLQVIKELKDSRLLFAIGKANVTDSFEAALKRGTEMLL